MAKDTIAVEGPAQMKEPKMGKKILRGIEIEPGVGGGHVLTHRFKERRRLWVP